MITVTEIRKKADKVFAAVLAAAVNDETYFPLTIRSDKSLSKNFVEMSKEIAHVMADSKDRKGFGYTIFSEKIKHRMHGIQDIPKSIVFETASDYLKFIGKNKVYDQFLVDSRQIINELPQLKDFVQNHPLTIVAHAGNWPALLSVCHWFLKGHPPGLYYARELPIPLHTKFIELNLGILRSLLNELLPAPDKDDPVFHKRFGLKYAEPRIRLRFLDQSLAVEGRFNDISLPLGDFAGANFNCKQLIITENKMNFLTLPPLRQTIAVWGGGYAVSNLKDIDWLRDKTIVYWGDIDAHGFEILSQLRSYYPHTRSVMMDQETFERFREYHGKGTLSRISSLACLTVEEQQLYRHVQENNGRLEQEKIPQPYINKYLLEYLRKM
jgi:hypothetical protein